MPLLHNPNLKEISGQSKLSASLHMLDKCQEDETVRQAAPRVREAAGQWLQCMTLECPWL